MFSELVDKIVTTSGRPDVTADIIDYTNTILRKIHGRALWDRNFKTIQISAPDRGFHCNYIRWERPRDFSVLRTIQTCGEYIQFTRPGRHLENATHYYYADGNEFVIVAPGITEATIGYYRKPARLKYYKPTERPAIFNCETERWQYLVPDSQGVYANRLETDEDEFVARRKVADWILHDYPDAVRHGVLNLVYSQLGDDQARSQFAIFNSCITDLIRVEEFSSTDN